MDTTPLDDCHLSHRTIVGATNRCEAVPVELLTTVSVLGVRRGLSAVDERSEECAEGELARGVWAVDV